MKFYIAGVAGWIIGYLVCALLSANERKALRRKLRRADRALTLITKVMDDLCLWSDREFDEAREAVDEYEEN